MSLHQNVVLDPLRCNLVEVVMHGLVLMNDGNKKPVVNVFHFWNTGGIAGGDFDPSNFIDDFKTIYVNPILNGINNSYTLGFISARAMNNPFSIEGDNTYASVGTTLGDSLPLHNAVVINFGTGIRGRSFIGRKHFGPISESFTTQQNLTGAGATEWTSIRDNFRDNLTLNTLSTDWSLAVLSGTLSDFGSTSPQVTLADITDVELNLSVGTMRRRKEKTVQQTG